MYVTRNALSWILPNNSNKNVILLRRHAKQTETAGSGKQRFARLPSALCFLFSLLSPYGAVLDLWPRGEPDVLSVLSLCRHCWTFRRCTRENEFVFVAWCLSKRRRLPNSNSFHHGVSLRSCWLELQIDVACKQVPFNEKRSVLPEEAFPIWKFDLMSGERLLPKFRSTGLDLFARLVEWEVLGRFCRKFKALTRLYITTIE